MSVVAGLVLAPVFHAMPPRLKLLGLHACVLGGLIGYACQWAAQSRRLGTSRFVQGVAAGVTLGALLLMTHWGLRELRVITAQRTPPLPIGAVNSPEQMSQSMEVRRQLLDALQPTLTDYERLRFHRTPALRRVRPIALWCGELFIAAVAAAYVARIASRGNPETPDRGQPSPIDASELLTANQPQ